MQVPERLHVDPTLPEPTSAPVTPQTGPLPRIPLCTGRRIQSAFGRFLFFVTKEPKWRIATLKPALRSHVGLLSAGAWNKHEQSMRPVGLLR